jgi:hypothetical protein
VFGIVSSPAQPDEADAPHRRHGGQRSSGKPVEVALGKFVKAYAFCPKGYYVVRGGSYAGAIREIVSSATSDLHGWFVDGYNTDTKTTFTHRATRSA